MNQKFTLPTLFFLCALAFCKPSFAINYTNTGAPTTYNLGNGDTLFAISGNYTGTIGSFSSGAVIIISDMANFTPIGFPNTAGNSAAGTITNYGTFSFAGNFRTNTNFKVNNYGVFYVGGTTLMNGNSQVWTNNFGALLTLNGAVTVNGTSEANSMINYGALNTNSSLTMTSGALIENHKNMSVGGEFRINGGTFINDGKVEVTGLLNFNNGAAVIYNYCRMIVDGGIRNTSNNFYNYNYLYARGGDITNSGTIYNIPVFNTSGSVPIIHGTNFAQSGGSITGTAKLYFTSSTTSSGGTTGTAGVTSDTLKMYDLSRGSTTTFYDGISGAAVVYPNAIYNAWGVPDPTIAYLIGCSVEILLEVPLAISWNYFYVTLNDKVPALTWSAEYDPGTVFEVQRSYDGTNFYGIKDVASEVGRSDYKHDDRMVNTRSPFVYYRIKASEPGGETKYSETRVVRFANKQGAITYTSPNPFTSNFIINYHAAEKEMLTIRMFNVSGQQKLVKNVMVNNGVNSIRIAEASNFASGIYFIQVSNGENIISSSKIVKQ